MRAFVGNPDIFYDPRGRGLLVREGSPTQRRIVELRLPGEGWHAAVDRFVEGMVIDNQSFTARGKVLQLLAEFGAILGPCGGYEPGYVHWDGVVLDVRDHGEAIIDEGHPRTAALVAACRGLAVPCEIGDA